MEVIDVIYKLYTRKAFYASSLMTAFLLLQVALASISPLRLFETVSNRGVDSYIRAMEISDDSAVPPKPATRARTTAAADNGYITNAEPRFQTDHTRTQFQHITSSPYQEWIEADRSTDMVARK